MPFKIKEARKEKGFTQEELAKRANVSRATIISLYLVLLGIDSVMLACLK